MKQQWLPQELIDHWMLTEVELALVNTYHTDPNKLGCALLLKCFQREGKFPQRKQDIPRVIVEYIAEQLQVEITVFDAYKWEKGIIDRHRSQIRNYLNIRIGTVADANTVLTWLGTQHQLLETHNGDRLKEVVYDKYKELKIEPPPPGRIDRIIRSAVSSADAQFYTKIAEKLTFETRKQLEELLTIDVETGETTSALFDLKSEAGAATLENVLAEVAKLERISSLHLPADLFTDVLQKRLMWCKQRIAVEDLHEVRRHPAAIRYSLLAAFCHQRKQEITDTLIELLISIIHKIGSRAEHRVNKEVIKEVKRVQGKNKLLYDVAAASLDNPDGKIKDIIYPIVGEQTLQEIIQEFKANGTYDQQVQVIMRGSYSNHYRRMVPVLLRTLTICATNEVSKPLLTAMDLIRNYADKNTVAYPDTETVPIDGIVPDKWLPLVKQGGKVNRISYELCVLRVVRDKMRCKEIYAQGAYRYRNPDEDLPSDFATKQKEYYADLNLPLSATEFIATQKQDLKAALTMLDKGMLRNNKVEFTKRNRKAWIKLTPLDPQPEPRNLAALKAEVGKRWQQIYLLDMLKEVDIRIGFTTLFKSPTSHEILPRETLQIRLLLCLYGLGTNAGMKRVASGAQIPYRDLLYILHRFVNKDGLRASIAEIANAVLRERDIAIWGEATSVASDSRKMCAWDQNLMTEWHIRYRGPGIMVYWHVEKKSLCIYSQIKRCSSSEVAAMIEGVLRHATDMNVEKNYVDSHGQDGVAFAFCYLLNFQLLPRLKAIGKQKLSRPEAGNPQAYPHLQEILTKPINWELIQKYYDEIVKYTTALKLGTADAEAILSRFTKNGVQHPAYQAIMELGKVRKTIFLCEYLNSEALRQEIEEGLNVVENWNSANDFIWYGKGGEIAVNNKEDQEIAILSLHLLQICIVYINTLLVQKVLSEKEWLDKMQPEDFRGLTPLFYSNVNPYGRLILDMAERILI